MLLDFLSHDRQERVLLIFSDDHQEHMLLIFCLSGDFTTEGLVLCQDT